MEDHEDEHPEEVSDFLLHTEMAKPLIFEGPHREQIPAGFDAVTIHIDGRVKADLNWKDARKEAAHAVERGLKIMWALDLGLFDQLAQPLTNQGQFLSLSLSIEHFRDTFWKEFKESTLGVSLYRGIADLSLGFAWDFHQESNLKEWLKESCSLEPIEITELKRTEEGKQLIRLFCRDVLIEYLLLLASRLPDTLSVYLFLDGASFGGVRLHEIQYFNPERFERFHLALKNTHLPFEAIGWGAPTSFGYSGKVFQPLSKTTDAVIGVCIPQMSFNLISHYKGFEEALSELQRLSLPFRLIEENALTSRWDGLDYLIFSPAGLSVQGKRKLQGFCAAGGTVVSIGELIGLPQELGFKAFKAFNHCEKCSEEA